MSIFHGMPRERVTLVKTDGRRFDVSAIVQAKMILTEDPKLPIEDGDQFERTLPSGVRESFTVLDAGFQQGFAGASPSHYQSKVRKNTAVATAPVQPHVVYNLVGANSRVNIQSSDSSTNVVSVESSVLFENLRQAIRQSSLDSVVAQQLVENVNAMQSSAGTKTFGERYKEFIAVAADHMTLIAPFLPALTQLLL